MTDWLNQTRLKEVLSYDPLTGGFHWRTAPSNRVHVGNAAGCPNNNGYLRIRIDGRLYLCHRLAWLYMTGVWPEHQVDHKHGVRDDNRWSELQAATPVQNQQNVRGPKANNKSGLLGVAPHGSGWRAQIMTAGKRRLLGTFRTPQAAHQAYLVAKRDLHPRSTL
jgi:hypothetical protein